MNDETNSHRHLIHTAGGGRGSAEDSPRRVAGRKDGPRSGVCGRGFFERTDSAIPHQSSAFDERTFGTGAGLNEESSILAKIVFLSRFDQQ